MNQKFLVIPRIQFRGANAQPAWWCSAAPGPLAFCGFGHALARAIGQAPAHRSIGIVFHDYRMRAETPGGWLLHPHQHRAAALINEDDYAQGSRTLSGQPTIRGDGIVSLVLAFDQEARISTHAVAEFLDRARVAGGTISEHMFDPDMGFVKQTWEEVTRMLGSGFTFVDRQDLLQHEEAQDPLHAFLHATRQVKGDKPKHSWLMPYAAGFRALTPVTSRHWAREGCPHAFAEPLVGLGQLVSVRDRSIAMWSYATAENGVFVVKQLDAVIPA